MLLYDGYIIETISNSEATLVFADESTLRLEENSRIVVSGDPSSITAKIES